MAHARDGTYATHVFGLNLELPFAVPGCPPRASAPGRPSLTLSVAGGDEVAALWAGRKPIPLLGVPDAAELVAEGDGTGYRLCWEGVGDFVLPGDGRIVCTREPGGEGRWDRFLVAQVLPLAAVVAGAEVLHASAVVLDGEVVGVVGASGAGKSTIAAQLVDLGAAFFTDDVLALTATGERVLAHPGPNLLRLEPDPGVLAGEEDASGKVATAPDAIAEALPLGRLLFIDRSKAIPEFSVGEPVGFEDLAAATFNLLVRTPERLRRQFDLYAHVAADARPVRAAIPASLPAQEVADLLAHHLRLA